MFKSRKSIKTLQDSLKLITVSESTFSHIISISIHLWYCLCDVFTINKEMLLTSEITVSTWFKSILMHLSKLTHNNLNIDTCGTE